MKKKRIKDEFGDGSDVFRFEVLRGKKKKKVEEAKLCSGPNC